MNVPFTPLFPCTYCRILTHFTATPHTNNKHYVARHHLLFRRKNEIRRIMITSNIRINYRRFLPSINLLVTNFKDSLCQNPLLFYKRKKTCNELQKMGKLKDVTLNYYRMTCNAHNLHLNARTTNTPVFFKFSTNVANL